MLTRTETAIASRVGTLLGRARNAIDRGVLDAAADDLAEARGLDPGAEGLALLENRLQAAERDLQRRLREEKLARSRPSSPQISAPAPAAVVKAPVLSRKKQKEIADLYRRGMEAMGEERPDDALRYWELVWLADPDFQNVADFLKREYLLRGLESFSQGGLDEAIRLWEKARDVDPNDEKTLGYLSRAREQQQRSQEILGE
ncbi:MAG: hypothetical protein DHS20C21_10270 [Gemmatimonadota bacterium]|nr:MAG: hypothetical protein DHS20C21_10270 [Gemmatimonadota bacterium]